MEATTVAEVVGAVVKAEAIAVAAVTTGTSPSFSKLQLPPPPVAAPLDSPVIIYTITTTIITISMTLPTTWTSSWATPIFTIRVRNI
jgi:hypothetical protein